MSRVLVSPLNWGLGHATRDIPIIRNLIAHGHDVTFAATGNARAALEQEFPDCRSIECKDYPAPYSGGHFFLPKFFLSSPLLLKAIADERQRIGQILARDAFDLIISDNRFGVCSRTIPSIFITHQLQFRLPPPLRALERLAAVLNGRVHRHFRHVIVPDNPCRENALAGELSSPGTEMTAQRVFFCGILTGIRRSGQDEALDYLVMISGPEPQRRRLAEILVPQIRALEGSRVILMGSPASREAAAGDSAFRILPYATTAEKEDLMNRARCIICRSGYTSVMEVAELGKRSALFIPTPGQPEQEYLSRYYEERGWFPSRSQYRLDLPRDLRAARDARYRGFPPMPKSGENVERLYDQVLARYLE